MLLIVQRCPWPAIPQPPLFTKFLRPGRIDYLGHVIHIEGVCVPELIITTLAVLTQTDALCIACPSAQVPPKPYRLKGFGQKQATSEITKSYPLEIWRKLGRNRLMLLANYCLCNIWSKKRVKSTRKLFHKKHWVKAISVDTKYPILSKYKEFCWRKQCTVHMLVNEAGCIRWPPPPLPLPMGVM